MKHAPVDIAATRQAIVEKRDPFEEFAKYRMDPVAFAADILGIEAWDKQSEFMNAVAEHDRVAHKKGQKTGGSLALAAVALWFVSCYEDARVVYTNSSSRQVRHVNFRELRRLYRKSAKRIGGTMFDTPDRGLEFPDGRQVIGFTSDSVDAWGGISGKNLLFIVDEASGIPLPIMEAILGNSAGDNARIVLNGNPLRPDGFFYDCFAAKGAGWKLLTTSSLDTPNYKLGRSVIPGLASRKWAAEMAERDGGAESPLYQVRVLGEFARQSEHAVIGMGIVADAIQRFEQLYPSFESAGDLHLGVDCARFGDDESVVVVRRGRIALAPVAFRNLDGPGLAAKVAELAERFRRQRERPIIKIDVIGLGASPFDFLKQYDWLDVVPIEVSRRPTINDHYALLRDQLWFGLRDWLTVGGAIADDEQLRRELLAPIYFVDVRGNRKVESKADIKKKLKRSPDRADALALAVYSGRVSINESTYDAPMVQRETNYDDDKLGAWMNARLNLELDWRAPE